MRGFFIYAAIYFVYLILFYKCSVFGERIWLISDDVPSRKERNPPTARRRADVAIKHTPHDINALHVTK